MKKGSVQSGLSSHEKFKAGDDCVATPKGGNQVPSKPTKSVKSGSKGRSFKIG